MATQDGTKGSAIENSQANTLLTGTEFDDTIKNNGSNVTINAGAGNDSIYTSSRRNVTVFGGAGNDTIEIHGSNILIDGGADDDLIQIYSEATINVGDGNDTIEFNESFKKFTVENFDEGDVIKLVHAVDSITSMNGGIIALVDGKEISITGMNVSSVGEWIFDAENHVATYKDSTLHGAFADGNSIIYSAYIPGQTLLELEGVNSGAEIYFENDKIS